MNGQDAGGWGVNGRWWLVVVEGGRYGSGGWLSEEDEEAEQCDFMFIEGDVGGDMCGRGGVGDEGMLGDGVFFSFREGGAEDFFETWGSQEGDSCDRDGAGEGGSEGVELVGGEIGGWSGGGGADEGIFVELYFIFEIFGRSFVLGSVFLDAACESGLEGVPLVGGMDLEVVLKGDSVVTGWEWGW